MDSHGYHANIYRVVFGGIVPVPERAPDLRLRHALFGGLRGHVPQSGTTAFAGYRFYIDDWGVVAHTPEARVVQELAPGLALRLRYRFYRQSAADFFKDAYTQEEVADERRFVTDDEKLSAHRTHTVGGQLLVALGLLGATGTLGDTTVEVVVERIWQTTLFGNAWNVQAALTVPFEY
jgi:hypothetical protein